MIDQAYLQSTHHSVSWFNNRFRDGELELTPPFQRNPVWTEKQKSYLIDSILNGLPIPELYMQEYSSSNGVERHVVVDGQQRIRACLEFIENRFPLSETDTDAWRDLTFESLSEPLKKKLFGYNFLVRLLPEMPESQLRSMFSRLNRNVVALNSQELRHATYWGPFIKSMESLADEPFWAEFGVFTPNDIRRMLDIEYVSELAVAYLHGVQNKKESLETWYSAYESEFENRAEVEGCFRKVAGELGQLLPNLHETRWRKKSDFYSLFLWLASRHRDLPLDRGQRDRCAAALVEFGEKVSELLRSDEPIDPNGGPERAYALAVARAASDFQSRKKRSEAIEKLLSPLVDS